MLLGFLRELGRRREREDYVRRVALFHIDTLCFRAPLHSCTFVQTFACVLLLHSIPESRPASMHVYMYLCIPSPPYCTPSSL